MTRIWLLDTIGRSGSGGDQSSKEAFVASIYGIYWSRSFMENQQRLKNHYFVKAGYSRIDYANPTIEVTKSSGRRTFPSLCIH